MAYNNKPNVLNVADFYFQQSICILDIFLKETQILDCKSQCVYYMLI